MLSSVFFQETPNFVFLVMEVSYFYSTIFYLFIYLLFCLSSFAHVLDVYIKPSHMAQWLVLLNTGTGLKEKQTKNTIPEKPILKNKFIGFDISSVLLIK